jgi:hypothetical protein
MTVRAIISELSIVQFLVIVRFEPVFHGGPHPPGHTGHRREAGGSISVQGPVPKGAWISTRMVNGSRPSKWSSTGSRSVAETWRVFSAGVDVVTFFVPSRGARGPVFFFCVPALVLRSCPLWCGPCIRRYGRGEGMSAGLPLPAFPRNGSPTFAVESRDPARQN